MSYLSKLFICFMIFSFIGWCLEVLYGLVVLKRFVNRGFLIGPLCPLYGLGCVLLYLCLKDLANNPVILGISSILLCSVLEYSVSYILEKIFKTRWWDYTDMKFNINGRICLGLIVPFGILGLLVVYILFPYTLNVLNNISNLVIYVLAFVSLTVFTIDFIISCNVIKKFKNISKKPRDTTEEMAKFVRETIAKKLPFLKKEKKSSR